MPLTPGTLLGNFEVLGPLGTGGMGEVYRARDRRLQRDVALKVLPESAVADPIARERLLREARLASSLNHPNICTIYEVGEDGGRVFVAMELVEGRSLHDVIGPTGLAAATALRYGIQVADALAFAHERGVVHRDLKSVNVMVTSEGRVKVLDFGLARHVHGAGEAGDLTRSISLTEPGVIVGTARYLSPEVLHGQEAGPKSDQWALGVLLHEMLTGATPFEGTTSFELGAAILHAAPHPLPATVPAPVRAVIARCLEKDPAHRYARAGEVSAALGAIQSGAEPAAEAPKPVRAKPVRAPRSRSALVVGAGVVIVAAVLVALNWGGLVERLRGPAGGADGRSLAVLPLENLSRDPGQAYFADGMTEELSTRLAKISALRVIAHESAARFGGHDQSLRDIGRQLRVGLVLRGSVREDSDQVRITVQLIQVATGKLLWAESYERALRNVLELQSEVATAIAQQVQVQLTPQEQVRVTAAAPVNPEAYRSLLLARHEWAKYTDAGFLKADSLYRHAVDIDPTYAPAWAGMSEAAYGVSSLVVAPSIAMPKARAAAMKALELDESLPEAHTSLGIVKMVYDWDWAGAEREFDRAIALRPGDANARLWRGHLLVCRGRFDEGIAEVRRALDLDPLSSWINANVGWHLYFARRYDEAIAHLKGAMQTDPGYFIYNVFLGLALEQKGDHAGAVAQLEHAVAVEENPDNLGQLAHAYGTAGRRADAERTIARMLALQKSRFIPAADLALAYAGVGDRDEAFRQLDRALVDHSEFVIFLKVEPGMDPLRSDPRFQAFLDKVHRGR